MVQFVGSRVGSPIIPKPVEKDVNGDVNLGVPNGKSIIQALESQADEM